VVIEGGGRSRCALKEVNPPNNAIEGVERVGTTRKYIKIM
jgi:hypothetical protein